MTISLLVVNYHSAELAAAAIVSAREATDRPLETVVVDNSQDPDQAEQLRSLSPDHLIIAEANLGYAGGINRGLGVCSGDLVIVSNPDVVYTRGSIDPLIDPLEDPGIAVTGPAFYWDRDLRWHLPPPETMGLAEQLSRNLRSSVPLIRKWSDHRRLSRRLRFWTTNRSIDAAVLSGAVMAFRSSTLRKHPFDERYPLYFEEVDLIRRLRKNGLTARYVPESRIQHAWAQSAARNPEAQTLFELSRRKFQKRWYGAVGNAILNMVPQPKERACGGPMLNGLRLMMPSEGSYLVELGDNGDFLMAAGRFVQGGETELPEESLRRSPLSELCCRVIDLSDRRVVQRSTVRIGLSTRSMPSDPQPYADPS